MALYQQIVIVWNRYVNIIIDILPRFVFITTDCVVTCFQLVSCMFHKAILGSRVGSSGMYQVWLLGAKFCRCMHLCLSVYMFVSVDIRSCDDLIHRN